VTFCQTILNDILLMTLRQPMFILGSWLGWTNWSQLTKWHWMVRLKNL